MQGKEFKLQHETSLNSHNWSSKMQNRWLNSQSAKGSIHRMRSSESTPRFGGVKTFKLKSIGQGSFLNSGYGYGDPIGSYFTGEGQYTASGLPTGDIARSYFTFELPQIERFNGDRIIEATLKIKHFNSDGDSFERLGLFSAESPLYWVDRTPTTDPNAYNDLGSGKRYGIHTILKFPGFGNEFLQLNQAALRDLNQAPGLFTIGASLLSNNASNKKPEALFLYSSGASRARLILKVRRGES